jgi:hypothetical protein
MSRSNSALAIGSSGRKAPILFYFVLLTKPGMFRRNITSLLGPLGFDPHPTKSKIEIGVSGKDGYFEDIKVWNATPAK